MEVLVEDEQLCPECMLCKWLSNDNHLAFIISPSLFGVEATHQYMWFMMLFSHSPIMLQSFCFAKSFTFFLKPDKIKHMMFNRGLQKLTHNLRNMPHIKIVFYLWMTFSKPLINLSVPVSYKNFNR